jgi:BirA family biotin operon repressor/biotin-[acetyl-CoA-carboxylase] ligase
MVALDVEHIRQPISGVPRERLDILEVFAEIESTNSYLLDQACPPPGRFRVALAEHQTAGRGRLDRSWQSPRASGLCMSMSYTFATRPQQLPCLALAIGIGVARSLEKLGIRGIGLKWPNDIVACDGKVGGILTEVVPGQRTNLTVVVGIGLNVDFREAERDVSIRGKLGPATDLRCCAKILPDRASIAVTLIEQLFDTLCRFESDGFEPFVGAWYQYDWLRGQQVRVNTGNSFVIGHVQGIEKDGAIIIKTNEGLQSFYSGSVSLIA